MSRQTADSTKTTEPSILSCAVVELEEDMITVKGEPKAVLDSKTTAPMDSELYHHAFYEAPSIRKIGDLYYLVYSSGENNELAYATSRYPDRDFQYRGVIISNSDLGYKGNTIPKAPAGTIHGGIECVNSQWYVFYHRCTNNTDFSRQACAEPITVLPDGSIPQVEITTQGISGKPIPAEGDIPAAYACHLTTGKTFKLGIGKQQTLPRIDESEGEVYVADLSDNTQVGYKYFDFRNVQRISVTYRGAGEGILEVRTQENGNSIGTIPIQPSLQWTQTSGTFDLNGAHALYLRFHGKGRIDLKTITFLEEDA